MEPATGIEPATFSLQVRRTASCATPAYLDPLKARTRTVKIFVRKKIYYPKVMAVWVYIFFFIYLIIYYTKKIL